VELLNGFQPFSFHGRPLPYRPQKRWILVLFPRCKLDSVLCPSFPPPGNRNPVCPYALPSEAIPPPLSFFPLSIKMEPNPPQTHSFSLFHTLVLSLSPLMLMENYALHFSSSSGGCVFEFQAPSSKTTSPFPLPSELHSFQRRIPFFSVFWILSVLPLIPQQLPFLSYMGWSTFFFCFEIFFLVKDTF